MPRLTPSNAPLWRSPTSLQLGIDGDVRVETVQPWQERLLDALIEGVPEAMLHPLARCLGASGADAATFIADLRPAFAADDPPVTARVAAAAGVPDRDAEVFASSLRHAGLDDGVDDTSPLVIVAARLVEPRHAAALVARDIAHLPVHLAGDRVEVGPLIVPGATACLACIHATRTDADPTWPALAAQLLGRAPVATAGPLLLEAAAIAARMLTSRELPAGAAVTLRADSARRAWRVHRPHPRCWCRVPAGIATAADRDVRSIAPTSARATAQPA